MRSSGTLRLTPYRRHVAYWQNCTKCLLHTKRNYVTFCRGRIPAPILFIGEAPGVSENLLGQPFVGPAGHLLDQIITQAVDGQYDYCLTNIVGCIPLTDKGIKTGEPPKEAIMACRKKLEELVALVRPQLVVRVGKLATKHVILASSVAVLDMVHPAAILRMDPSQQGLAIQRCVVSLEDAIAEL